ISTLINRYKSCKNPDWLIKITRFRYALIGGKSKIVKLYLGQYNNSEEIKSIQIDINAKFHDMKTPLIIAVEEGKIKIIKLLLEHGANVNYTNGTDDCLLIAFNNNKLDIFELLLESGALIHKSSIFNE